MCKLILSITHVLKAPRTPDAVARPGGRRRGASLSDDDSTDVDRIVDGWEDCRVPPTMSGLFATPAAVRELAPQGSRLQRHGPHRTIQATPPRDMGPSRCFCWNKKGYEHTSEEEAIAAAVAWLRTFAD